MADDVPNVIGGDFDPFSPTPSPGAAALNGGGKPDTAQAEFYREQIERERRLAEREEELYAKREAEEEPMRQDYARSLKDFSRTSAAATDRLLRSQQDIPKFDAKAAQGDVVNMIAIASTVGALFGGLSRNHMTAANNAFAGMLNGFAKGQITVFDQKYQEWQANSERALEMNRRTVDEYKAIMNNQKLGLDVKANLMQMTANKWQDQIMANAAQLRDTERMTQLMMGQDRANERLDLSRKAFEEHKKIWDLNRDYKIRQMYGAEGDVEGAVQQILSLQTPMPTQQAQARYPYLRDAANEVRKRNPSYKASDYTADQTIKKMAATGDIMAMRQALGKMIAMQAALATFEPVAEYNGNVILSLIGKVDSTGTQSVFEAWSRAGKKATGDPDVQQFDQAVQNLKTEAARIIQNPSLGGQLTDTARGEMGALLPENITIENARRAVPFLQGEMKYRRELINSQIEYLQGSIQNRAEGKPPPIYVNPDQPPIIPPMPPLPADTGPQPYEVVE